MSRLLSLLLVLALLAAACTGGEEAGESSSDPASPAPAASDAADGGGAPAGQPIEVPVVDGADIDVDEALLQAAQRWIVEESGLSEMLQSELFLSSATRNQDVTHLTYVQQHDSVSVQGAQFVVHIRDDGEVVGASESLTTVLPASGTTEELTAEEAVAVATKAVPSAPVVEPTVGATWLEVGDALRLGWEVVLTTADFAAYTVVVDATTGEVLSVDQITVEHAAVEVAQAGGCNAPAPPSACIFVVNPIFASGDPGITVDRANATLVGVPLANLLDPGDGRLVGRYARVAESELALFSDPDNVFGEQGRGGIDPTFDAAMTYYWIDYTQQVMQSLGFDYHADDSVDFIPLAGDVLDNAFYVPPLDLIVLGVTSNGRISLAEEAEVTIHEYGHAIVESVVPGTLGPEAGAFNEAFSDMVAVFTTLELRTVDQACLTPWFGRELGLPGNCTRRVDTDKVFPDDVVAEVHLDGEIYTGAVWDVFTAVLARDTGLDPSACADRATNPCDAVRDQVFGTMLGSLPFLTPRLTLRDAAAAFLAADELFHDSANAEIITQAFTARGLDPSAGTAVQMMSGGPMRLGDLARSDAQVTLKLSHERRGDLSVSVSVLDPDGNLSCTLTLLQPNDADTGRDVTGRFDIGGTPCEAHLPPSPVNNWVLQVVDTTPGATGTYFQFSVIADGQQFLATGPSLDIPDADGRAVVVSIPEALPPEGQMMTDPAPQPGGEAGTIVVDYAITHTFTGDLAIQLAVLDPDPAAADPLLCILDIRQPRPGERGDDLAESIDASACAGVYPPGPDQLWILGVQDLADLDQGTIDRFAIRGPDGSEFAVDGPVPIPDNDRDGAFLVIPAG